MVKFSLVPQCTKKFHLIDVPKDYNLELRSLPPLELYILLPESYPSNSGPLFIIPSSHPTNALFYD